MCCRLFFFLFSLTVVFTTVKAQDDIGLELTQFFNNRIWYGYAERIGDTLSIYNTGIEQNDYSFLNNQKIRLDTIDNEVYFVFGLSSIKYIQSPITSEFEWIYLSCNPTLAVQAKSNMKQYIGKFYSEEYVGPTTITFINDSLFSWTLYENNDKKTVFFRIANDRHLKDNIRQILK